MMVQQGGSYYDYSTEGVDATEFLNRWQNAQNSPTISLPRSTTHMSGNKPVVICNGTSHECKDMDEAQAKAEALAHQHSADAYILKPIKKIAPKRDVVTTDLP